MNYFSYIVARDYGFAPNPYFGYCTLATCKPGIREAAQINDWVFGTGAAGTKTSGKIVYAMQVTEKISFDNYWSDPRFRSKKPEMIGSLKQMYGDNIYHKDAHGIWIQENSHHTYSDGSTNLKNLNKDTGSNHVLISENFYYLGGACIDIPIAIKGQICMPTQGFKYVNESSALSLIDFLTTKYPKNYHRPPLKASGTFERFKG